MVQIPLAMFEGRSPTPCNSATQPPANKRTKDEKAQEKPYIHQFSIGPKTIRRDNPLQKGNKEVPP